MNKQIETLFGQALDQAVPYTWSTLTHDELVRFSEKFAELIKQAIYDDVKQDLIDEAEINAEPDSLDRRYLRGVDGGITDALYRIKMFGVDEEQ